MGRRIDDKLREQLQRERNATSDPSPDEMLVDIRDVGPDKPMGYLPLRTITDLCHANVEALVEEARSKGLKTAIFEHTPVLAVWDEKALQALLDSKRSVLTKAGWPTEANQFAEHVFLKDAPKQTLLFDLVADAYKDYRNPGRLELGEPISVTDSFAVGNTKRNPLIPDGSGWGKKK